MMTSPELLTVRVYKSYNQSGDEVRFPGFYLGSWLNMEAFMLAFLELRPSSAELFQRPG